MAWHSFLPLFQLLFLSATISLFTTLIFFSKWDNRNTLTLLSQYLFTMLPFLSYWVLLLIPPWCTLGCNSFLLLYTFPSPGHHFGSKEVTKPPSQNEAPGKSATPPPPPLVRDRQRERDRDRDREKENSKFAALQKWLKGEEGRTSSERRGSPGK